MKIFIPLLVGLTLTGFSLETGRSVQPAGIASNTAAEPQWSALVDTRDEAKPEPGSATVPGPTPSQRQPLDLSLPAHFSYPAVELVHDAAEPTARLDDLLANRDSARKRQPRVSLMIVPSLEDGAELTDLSSIDGGSIDVTIDFK